MRTILKSTEIKDCEFTSGKKTFVMELIFKNGENEVRILIKDLIDGDDSNIIKQAKKKAKEYFDNLKEDDGESGQKKELR